MGGGKSGIGKVCNIGNNAKQEIALVAWSNYNSGMNEKTDSDIKPQYFTNSGNTNDIELSLSTIGINLNNSSDSSLINEMKETVAKEIDSCLDKKPDKFASFFATAMCVGSNIPSPIKILSCFGPSLSNIAFDGVTALREPVFKRRLGEIIGDYELRCQRETKDRFECLQAIQELKRVRDAL